MRHHNDPTRKTAQAQKTAQAEDNSSSESAHIPGSHQNCHKHGGAAPVTWRCTRTEEVHCLRIGCSAPTNKNKCGTGTPNRSPPHPSMRSWALLVAGWARRPRRPRRPRRHLHSGLLRHPHSGPLRHPHSGPPRHPHSGPPRHPHSGPLRHPHSGPLRHPHSGPLRHPYMRRASKRPGSRQRPRPLRL